MPYSAKAIANYFLDKADADRVPLSPMKIQKLVYLAHGWHLAITGKPLLDELVEAWQYGPVIPSIYHEFKDFGNQPITRKATEAEIRGSHISFREVELGSTPNGNAEELRAILDRVRRVYSGYTAGELSARTHEANTPWRETWDSMEGIKYRNQKIDNPLIEKHFLELSGETANG